LLSETVLNKLPWVMQCVLSMIITLNRTAHVASNFNRLFKNDKLIEVTCSHLHSKHFSILETVQAGVTVTTYQ